MRIVFASQGAPVQLHALTRDHRSDPGIQVDIREVTSDAYRASANSNAVDVFIWKNDGMSGPVISRDATMLVPPFGDVFTPGSGFDRAACKASDGAQGSEPPADTTALWDPSAQVLTRPLGSADSDRIGAEIVDIHVDSLLKVGVIADIPPPHVHRNDLRNLQPPTARTHDFSWAYPCRPQPWFLSDN